MQPPQAFTFIDSASLTHSGASSLTHLLCIQDWGCCCATNGARENFPLTLGNSSSSKGLFLWRWHRSEQPQRGANCLKMGLGSGIIVGSQPSHLPTHLPPLKAFLPSPTCSSLVSSKPLCWPNTPSASYPFPLPPWHRKASTHLCTSLTTPTVAWESLTALLQHFQPGVGD